MSINKIILGVSIALTLGCASPKKNLPEPTSMTPPSGPAISTKIAEPVSVKGEDKKLGLVCKRAQETRTMNWENSLPSGCKLFYSNYSAKDAVAWSQTGITYCEQVRDRIRANLEIAGFKCSPSGVSTVTNELTTEAGAEPKAKK